MDQEESFLGYVEEASPNALERLPVQEIDKTLRITLLQGMEHFYAFDVLQP